MWRAVGRGHVHSYTSAEKQLCYHLMRSSRATILRDQRCSSLETAEGTSVLAPLTLVPLNHLASADLSVSLFSIGFSACRITGGPTCACLTRTRQLFTDWQDKKHDSGPREFLEGQHHATSSFF